MDLRFALGRSRNATYFLRAPRLSGVSRNSALLGVSTTDLDLGSSAEMELDNSQLRPLFPMAAGDLRTPMGLVRSRDFVEVALQRARLDPNYSGHLVLFPSLRRVGTISTHWFAQHPNAVHRQLE